MPAQKFVDKYTLKTLSMESTTIHPNNSQQHLMTAGIEATDVPNLSPIQDTEKVTLKQWVTVGILCFVNLINYMDRYTIAGNLTDIQTDFNVDQTQSGLLQTAFVISYMVFAPLFGYLGDRYNRRYLMAFGVFFWSLTTLLGSFMPNYYTFLLFRSLVGIGEASYSTIAPTIISDLFISDNRSKMLALFYFAIPVGSGMGYIAGSAAASVGHDWRWGLRVTPVLGMIAVFLILFSLTDPVRGEIEGKLDMKPSSYIEDIDSLCRNKSFILSTLGFTCVSFVTGALAWWGPTYIAYGEQIITKSTELDTTTVTLYFGAVTIVAGLVGVYGGAASSRILSKWCDIKALCLVCGVGVGISVVFLTPLIVTTPGSNAVTYIITFISMMLVDVSWSVSVEITMYVVVPPRRSTAEAFQILICHALGDAGSPYLVGLITDYLRNKMPSDSDTELVAFRSLQYALFSTCFVEVLGAVFFLINVFYIVDDRAKADAETQGDSTVGGVPQHMFADDPRLTCSEANLTTA